MTQPRSDHRPLPQSQADIARRRGCARSTVSRACKPGGALYPALVSRDRLDLNHPATRAFLRGGEPAPSVVETDARLRTPEQLAAVCAVPVAEVRRELADAIVPGYHLSAAEFARLAEVELHTVLAAADGELADAIIPSRRLDLGHRASLAFMAARPFRRKRNGDPIAAEGFLAPAAVDDDTLDLNAPHMRAWLARLDGRVPTEADIQAMLKGAHRA